ncbi:MAG: hypothetical protein WB439_08140 [Acidobacteriaceae bacterium]
MAWSWKGMNEAKRHLIVRGAIALAAYEIAFGATFYGVDKGHLSGSALMWMAVPPTLTVAAFILVIGRYLKEEVDEFHRELVVRCLLWGMAAVMTVMAFHGFLQLFGWTGSWPVFVDLGAFFVAMLAAKLTYKVANRVPAEA